MDRKVVGQVLAVDRKVVEASFGSGPESGGGKFWQWTGKWWRQVLAVDRKVVGQVLAVDRKVVEASFGSGQDSGVNFSK